MKVKLFLALGLGLFPGCNSIEDDASIEITREVINADYIGNGVQWDAYPEAESWGAAVSDEDWNKLYERLDYMQPQYVRCMINSPFRYFNPETGEYEKERNIGPLKRVLQYCQDNNITVLFGEFNPPTWEMKNDQRWIEMAANYLNYLVIELGFDCIKYYNLFNEPDGHWASTNGDFDLWKEMILRFQREMKKYPGLTEKVSIAGPDVVVDYNNPESKYNSFEWVDQTVFQLDSVTGIYDIHAYPGQHQVRSGNFRDLIGRYKKNIPEDKKIVFGEAGYKYWREADSLLMQEYNKRAEVHPFTKGSDSNMMVYDYFYGLDMSMLAMDIMNGGFSAIAAWMLDDAMHSDGDSGNTKDIKLWGMWNILGEEVFGSPEEENIRPWYYTWSLMCRYFPAGTDVLNVNGQLPEEIRAVAGSKDGKFSLALVNVSDKEQIIRLQLPEDLKNVQEFVYQKDFRPKNDLGYPVPNRKNFTIPQEYELTLENESFFLLTTFPY